jgi:hypothetical protein
MAPQPAGVAARWRRKLIALQHDGVAARLQRNLLALQPGGASNLLALQPDGAATYWRCSPVAPQAASTTTRLYWRICYDEM